VGPTKQGLLQSREIRQRFLDKYGYVPDSILQVDRSEKALDFFTQKMGGAYMAGAIAKAKRMKDRDVGSDTVGSLTVFRDSKSSKYYKGKGLEEKDRIFLSMFPQNVGRILVDIYCPEHGIVYDPFAGHNSRMELVYKTGRNYTGVDLSKHFMEANKKAREYLYRKSRKSLIRKQRNKIRLIRGSSAKVKLPDSYADMTITSPPYWDIEYYGSEKQQLGKAKTYQEFLDKLRPHIEENYRILKDDTFCIWVVNDFRREKIYYAFHIDLYNMFIESGFEPFHIYIMDYGSGFTSMFVQQIMKYKTFGKRHEYVMLFKKEARW
jgi:DNA modification methylase